MVMRSATQWRKHKSASPSLILLFLLALLETGKDTKTDWDAHYDHEASQNKQKFVHFRVHTVVPEAALPPAMRSTKLATLQQPSLKTKTPSLPSGSRCLKR